MPENAEKVDASCTATKPKSFLQKRFGWKMTLLLWSIAIGVSLEWLCPVYSNIFENLYSGRFFSFYTSMPSSGDTSAGIIVRIYFILSIIIFPIMLSALFIKYFSSYKSIFDKLCFNIPFLVFAIPMLLMLLPHEIIAYIMKFGFTPMRALGLLWCFFNFFLGAAFCVLMLKNKSKLKLAAAVFAVLTLSIGIKIFPILLNLI